MWAIYTLDIAEQLTILIADFVTFMLAVLSHCILTFIIYPYNWLPQSDNPFFNPKEAQFK